MATTPKLISTQKVRTFSNKDNTKEIKLSQTIKGKESNACVSVAYGYKADEADEADWSLSWIKLQMPDSDPQNEQSAISIRVAWLDLDNYLIIGSNTSFLYCGTTHVLSLPTFIVQQGYEYTGNTLNPAESSLTSYTHTTTAEDGSVLRQVRYKFMALYECEEGYDPEENNFYRTYHFDKPPEPDWS